MKGISDWEGEVSPSKMRSYTESVELLMNEIDEINENQVFVELARIEAVNELAEIEALRKEEYRDFCSKLAEKMSRCEAVREEIGDIEELEAQLVITLSDVNLLQNELEAVKGMKKERLKTEILQQDEDSDAEFEVVDSYALSWPIVDELQSAQLELVSVREEGVHLKAAFASLKRELTSIKEETHLQISEDDADVTIGELKLKLVDAKKTLRVLTMAEENGTSFVSNMSLALDQVKKKTEATNYEKLLLELETAMTVEEIRKLEDEIDLTEEMTASAVDELEAIKSMETLALERLQTVTESVMERRELESVQGSSITLSVFEYEYLTTNAEGAKEVADFKVSAAQAWVKALNCSTKEMLMKIENARIGYAKDEQRKRESLCRDIVPTS